MLLTKQRIAALAIMLTGAAAVCDAPEAWQAAQAQQHNRHLVRSYLKGLDVSSYQGTINWTMVKNAGYVFAACKATEGLTYVDPKFAANWAGIKNAGMYRSPYHYAHPNESATAQADFAINTAHPNPNGDLRIMLDLEVSDGQSASQIQSWINSFSTRVRDNACKSPYMYTYYYFWVDNVGNPSNNFDCELWIASYTNQPLVPHAWSSWTFWQYTDKGQVPGISGNVDLDYFWGTLTDLKDEAGLP